MTREEWIVSLDTEAATKEFRRKTYEPDVPDKNWEQIAPGAQETWRTHTQCILSAALGEDTK